MAGLLPCPLCSNVIHDGALSRSVTVVPSWLYAKMTSAKAGRDHFSWLGCSHSTPIGPVMPTADRAETEGKWNAEARRLIELRTANWPADKRETFARLLGFVTHENPV